ncbi:MAG: ABC transporter substrate-binding protein [Chloroflexota bacterium]
MRYSKIFVGATAGLIVFSAVLVGTIFIISPRLRGSEQPISIQPAVTSNVQDDESVVITFAAYGSEQEVYKDIIANFNQQNPAFNIQLVEIDTAIGNYDWNSLASLADTIILPGQAAIGHGADGYFHDLQPLIDADQTFNSEDFWSNTLASCQNLDGRTIGIPISMRVSGVFFDENAFNNAGLPYPVPGWTWAEFRQATTELANQHGTSIRYGFADEKGGMLSILAPLISQNLAKNGDEISPEAMANDLRWYIDLVKAEAIYPFREVQDWQLDSNQWEILFQKNPPAMWVGELKSLMPGGDHKENGHDASSGFAIAEAGFVPYPISSNNPEDRTTPIWSSCALISSGTSHPREAWEWLNFLSKHWVKTGADEAWGDIPARQSVADANGYWESIPKNVQPTVKFALKHAWYDYHYSQAYQVIQKALLKTLVEGVDLVTALQEARMSLDVELDTNPQVNNVTVSTPVPTPDATAESTVIDYAVIWMSTEEQSAFNSDNQDSLINQFNRTHPEIVVNIAPINSPATDQDWYTYLADRADCFTWYSDRSWNDQNTASLLNLTSLIDGEDTAWKQDFYPNQLASYRYKGELYGLPAVSQPTVMSYNADLLAKYGFEPPSTNWSFDDFIQFASDVVSVASENDKIYGYLYPVGDPFVFSGHGNFGLTLDTDPPTIAFNTPEMVNTFDWIGGLYQDGILLPYGDIVWEENYKQLLSGKVAFWSSLVGQPEGRYPFVDKLGYRIGVVPLPVTERADAFFESNLNRGFFISHQSKFPQACWTWIKFLSEQSTAFTGVPARRSTAESSSWEAIVGKDNAVTYRQAVEQIPEIQDKNYTQVWWPLEEWRRQSLSSMLYGESSELVLANVQRKADSYLNCIKGFDFDEMSTQELKAKVTSCAGEADPQGNWP